MANIILLLIIALLMFLSANPIDSSSSSVPVHYHDHEFKCNLNCRILQAGDPMPTSSTRDPTTSYNLQRSSIPWIVLLAITIVIILLLLIYIVTCLSRRRRRQAAVNDEELGLREDLGNDILQSGQPNKCRKFSLAAIVKATDHVSGIKKLGKGGFGTVYKVILKSDKQTQTVAVKRFSSTTGQGNPEFMNEVRWIPGLQHKNIVKLLGYCFEGGEKLLIYEFMTNKSLDTLLSDETNRLPWKTRMSIIKGIAQGLVYLHEDSGLKIIHLDIKPGNILLDHEMNPKISDFGTAKQFRDNQSEANHKRIVGTLGYMAPECRRGDFSPKSDVYSFGVVLLEIISAPEKCDHSLGIPVHTWELWCKGTPLELMDKQMAQSSADDDVVRRCIKIGLLCVQENAEVRPCMSSVLRMLENENITPSEPNKPPFAEDPRNPEASQQSAFDTEVGSVN